MNTIKLNNFEAQVESYNKVTYFNGEGINSNANCSIITDNITDLNTVAQGTITSIQIYNDETLIYNLQNVNAHIDSINEYLSGDRMNISVNMTFPQEEEEETEPEI